MINHCAQNRPVHQALRDAYFEEAIRLIEANHDRYSTLIRFDDYEEILSVLRTARQHAHFVIRESDNMEQDEQFGRFISLLDGNVKAILAMLNLKGMVDNSDTSFFSFLGDNQASVSLQAEEYQRRANDIVASIHKTLKLAEEPFTRLQADNAAAATEEELERYNKAYQHCCDRIRSVRRAGERITNGRSHRLF